MPSLCLMVFGLLLVAPLCAGADGQLQALDFRGWTAEGGRAAVADEGKMLRVEYADARGKAIRLLPSEPVGLPEGLTRLDFWFARVAGDFSLSLELLDAAGKTHIVKTSTSRMTSDAVLWNQDRRKEWSMWNRAQTPFLRAPGKSEIEAAVPVEDRERVEALLWPKPLRLQAIVVTPAVNPGWHAPGAYQDVQAGKGELVLAALEAETADGFAADTYWYLPERKRMGRSGKATLFPDDLTNLKGTIRYAVELRKGYFGPLVWSRSSTAQIDPADAAGLYAQRIELPALAPGRYFLSTRAWGGDNALEREQPVLTLWIAQQKTPEAVAAATGLFSLSTDVPHNVFSDNTTSATLKLQIAPEEWGNAPADAVCVVRVERSDRKPVFEQTLTRGGIEPVSVPVEAGEDYFAVAEIRAGDKVYDRAHLHFGVANRPDDISGVSVPGGILSRDEFLNGRADLTGEYWYGARARTYPWYSTMEAGTLEDFRKWAGMCRDAGASVLAVADKWATHEVLPGVYQWRETEAQMAIARSLGMKVQFGYSADGNALDRQPAPLWADYQLSRDQNGDLYADPSFWSPGIREGYRNYYRRVGQHYLGNSDLLCYRVRTINLRAPGYASIRLDYSAPAQAVFKDWLVAEKRKDSPMGRLLAFPEVRDDEIGYDLRPEWKNFTDFCSYTARLSALDQMNAIRESDPKRMVIVDQKPFPYAIEAIIPALKDGGALKNEDSPNLGAPMLRSMCVQAGVPYVEELHNHLPTSRSIADATDFWSSYHSRTIFWLIRGRESIIKDEPIEVKPNSWNQNTERWLLGYMKQTRPVWAEWIKAMPQQPQALVFGSRAQGLLGERRMGSDFEIGGKEVFSSLLCAHQVLAHFADEHTGWVDPKQFKIVFAAGEVMTEDAIRRLADYATGGGRLVLVGKAGDLCPELPGEREVLKKRVAGAANVRVIDAPQRISYPGVQEWAAPYAFDEKQLEPLLQWVGLERPVFARTESPLGFETQIRYGPEGKTVYVAAMRRWPGWYWNNIEREKDLKEKYGQLGGSLVVRGLAPGKWRIEKIHREAKRLPDATVSGAELTFPLDPALAGEVQIFRLTKE